MSLAARISAAVISRMPKAPEVTLVLPVPPSTNNLFATVQMRVGNKRITKRIKSAAYKDWLDAAALEIRRQRVPHIAGKVAVDIRMRQPNALSDPDNRIKAALDALVSSTVIEDDRHVVDVRIRWDDVADCVVTVRAAA